MKCLKQNIFSLTVVLCLQQTLSSAQNCDSNYFSFLYNATDFTTYSKAVAAPNNEVLALQTNKLYWHGLTKFTPQGNVIYFYGYKAPYVANGNRPFMDLVLTDLAVASDSVDYLAGSVTLPGYPIFPPARTAAIIIKINKYGIPVWSKYIAAINGDPLNFLNIIVLKNGDIVGYLTTVLAPPYYGEIFCLSANGDLKWRTVLNTGAFSLSNFKKAIIQSRSGNVIIADGIGKLTDASSDVDLHFVALSSTDGSFVWNKSYKYSDAFEPNIASATELPSGDLSFQTISPGASREINIITDNVGNIKKIVSTFSPNETTILIDAKADNVSGDQSILMNTQDNEPVLVQIDKDGTLKSAIKYGKNDAAIPPTCLAKNDNGYDIFLSEFSRSFRMLRTDPIGRLDCDTFNITMKQGTIPSFNLDTSVHLKNIPSPTQGGYFDVFFVVENSYVTIAQRSTVCEKNIPCCVDIVDTNHINNIDLCEGSKYQLPDKTIVQDSGKYYVSYKTLKGCDSISLFKINVYKNPSALSLGADTCFNGSSSIKLQATSGYTNYTWQHDYTITDSIYTVKDSGIYTVNVSNVCGSKTDSVKVYNQCDFPIYIPNAFTPNGDRINDIFRVPVLNVDKFIRLTIYNRWGNIIFQTTDRNKGWDGTVNSVPQQQGIYIYNLQMKDLIGNIKNKRGTFTLIR